MADTPKNVRQVGHKRNRGMGPKPKLEHPMKTLKKIFKFIGKKYTPHMIIVLVCIFTTVFSSVQGTWFMKSLIDDYINPMLQSNSTDFTPLIAAIIRVACFYGIGVLASLIQSEVMIFITQGTMRDLRDTMFEHMQGLPIKYFDINSTGDIMSMYTNDIDTMRQMISQAIPQMLNSAITIVSVLIAMISLSIPLSLLTLLMIVIVMLFTKKFTTLSGKYFVDQQKNTGIVNGYIEEMMAGQKVVKVFCHEEKSISEFNELNNNLFASAYNANKFSNILGPFNAQLGNLSYVLCACLGGVFAIAQPFGFSMSAGALVSFLTYNKQFSQPINQITMQINSIVMALAGGDRIFKLLEEEPEVDDGYVTLVRARKDNGKIVETKERTGMWAWKHYHKDDDSTTYTEMKGEIVFNGVDFGYNDDKMVLHDVKLYANPGQ